MPVQGADFTGGSTRSAMMRLVVRSGAIMYSAVFISASFKTHLSGRSMLEGLEFHIMPVPK